MPHFHPQNYGCCVAIISRKNEGLVNADTEWMTLLVQATKSG
jgi:hypothetical protein